MIAASLRDFGYVVATAGTVAEGLELAHEFKFDVCILDMRLPDGNGIELCQKIRERQPMCRWLTTPPTQATRNKKPRSRFAATHISKSRFQLKFYRKQLRSCSSERKSKAAGL